jgi:hypothetical protein
MRKIEVETDSKGISTIELSNLDNNKYNEIINIMTSNKVEDRSYELRVRSGAKIKWIDENKQSLCIIFSQPNYTDFIELLNKKFDL